VDIGPPIPPGRRVQLPGRGTTFVREVAGPPGAPTLVLLHGWIASGGLNWFTSFDVLGQFFHVVAPDLRGHGRGIRSRRHFRLADCADDVAALCQVLGLEQVVVAGYSLGGPIAQLVWRRHPGLVSGIVLAATGDCFVDRARDRLVFSSMMAAAAGISGGFGLALHLPVARLREGRVTVGPRRRAATLQQWAAAEMARHDWTTIFQAGRALGLYDARPWLAEIDVPVAVVVTTKDMAVPTESQLAMAGKLADATVHRVEGGHTVCARRRFAPVLLEACLSVADRVAAASATDHPLLVTARAP
jgi:3-oxoadipate enol-lactonase